MELYALAGESPPVESGADADGKKIANYADGDNLLVFSPEEGGCAVGFEAWMTLEEKRLENRRFARIRRTKWMLRRLPRRANIHRYPILKWFAEHARGRPYLWSMRNRHVIPAIYLGCVVAMLPIYGAQLLVGFALALVLRANLMVTSGLVCLTNPLTAVPLFMAAFWVGDALLPASFLHMPVEVLVAAREGSTGVTPGDGLLLRESIRGFVATTLGGTLIGLAAGAFISAIYRFVSERSARENARMREALTRLRAMRQHAGLPPKGSEDAPPDGPATEPDHRKAG